MAMKLPRIRRKRIKALSAVESISIQITITRTFSTVPLYRSSNMIARWMPLPYIFILTLFIPEYHAIRTINYGSWLTDRNTDQVIQRFGSDKCEGEESVSFKEFNLIKVPATAIKSRTIKNINLEDNLLTEIPTELFDHVPLLECLNVAYNKIPYQNIFDFGHSKLKTLIVDHQSDIDHCNMLNSSKLYYPFIYPNAHFPNLENLHVNGISRCVLDVISESLFPQLTKLYLTDNEFQYIKADFFYNLPASLEHLHLERNSINKIEVSNSISNLLSLYLDDNPVKYLDITSKYTNLEILSLRNCSLNANTLEYNFYLNYLDDLKLLDLSVNSLERVPENLFDNARYLQYLDLSNNSLTKIPDVNKLQQLRKLSLSYNDIEIVTNLTSNTLTVLNLKSNKISTITNFTFKHVPVLKELDLSNNKLEYLTPGWAHDIKNLKLLNVRFNRFATIADMSLRPLVDLKILYIKGNLFNEMNEHDIQLTPENCTTYVT